MTLFFIIAAAVSMIATEILRSIIHRCRERQHGIGGTQDIAMIGTLIGVICVAGAAVSGALDIFHRITQ